MSQNIYDSAGFFDNYSQLNRSVYGLDGAAEWPRLRSLLPEIEGCRVLDLGCGFGWFCRWASDQGASSVHGIDLSLNMLERARIMTEGKYQSITYQRADLDGLKLPEEDSAAFDLVFSSLALHYLTNCSAVIGEVYRVLKPKGQFVFSIEHPIFTAPSKPGMVKAEAGYKYWALNDYQKEGERITNWLADGVRKRHRTVTTYVNMLLGAGFELTGFNEWHPTPEELAANPDVRQEWCNETIKPTFLLMRAVKKD